MSRVRIRRTNLHHRKSRSRTGGVKFNGEINGVPNVQLVDYKRHQAFHCLFQDTHPKAIARELNQYWCDPEYEIVAVFKRRTP